MKAIGALLGALMALLCFGTAAPAAFAAEDTLIISFADVGEADCILLQCGGTNVLVDGDAGKLRASLDQLMRGEWKHGSLPERWDGRTAERIVRILVG